MKSLSFQHPRNRRLVKTNQNVFPFRSRFIFIINHHMNCQFVIHLWEKDPHTFWSNVWKGEDQGWLTGLHVDYPCSCGVNSLHNSLVNSHVHFSEFTTQWCLLLSEFTEQLHNSLHMPFTAQLHVQFGMTGEEGHTSRQSVEEEGEGRVVGWRRTVRSSFTVTLPQDVYGLASRYPDDPPVYVYRLGCIRI